MENFAYGEINEQNLKNPHPWSLSLGKLEIAMLHVILCNDKPCYEPVPLYLMDPASFYITACQKTF